jgi:hypothetical protein
MTDKSIEDALAEFRSANRAYATQQAMADQLEFQRPIVKEEAIRFLMTPTGDEKPLAYTAAERQVETVPAYAAHCNLVREAREATQRRWGEMKAAQLYATAFAHQQEPVA